MIRVGGIEPPYVGVKVLCLTAWRHPYNIQRLYVLYVKINPASLAGLKYVYKLYASFHRP